MDRATTDSPTVRFTMCAPSGAEEAPWPISEDPGTRLRAQSRSRRPVDGRAGDRTRTRAGWWTSTRCSRRRAAPVVATTGPGLPPRARTKAFDASERRARRGPEPVESAEERAGVPATDTSAESPLGVGVSSGSRGEDLAEDEREEGTKGRSDRPYGGSS